MVIRKGLNSNGEELRDAYVEHEVPPFYCNDDGVTRQEFKDECDINVLLAQYERTGVLNHFNTQSPQYLDVTDVPDLQGALDMVATAQGAFMSLPAKVRKEFDNDPVKFVSFAQDPANIDQMRDWNLAPPAPVRAASPSPEVRSADQKTEASPGELPF